MADLESSLAQTLPAAQPCGEERRALAVARGICRLFARNETWCLAEMPLRCGRRADLMGIDAKGRVIIVEIKVSRADLLCDQKWPDYLDYCDHFFWAVPAGFSLAHFDSGPLGPGLSGLIVADRYDAAVVREAPMRKLAPARRKAETLRFARRAARRLVGDLDPGLATLL